MKKTIAALAACALMPLAAQAAVLKYEFTATMSELTEWMPWVKYDVTEGPTAGSSVALGDKLTGYFQFDTSTPYQADYAGETYYNGTANKNYVSVTMADGQTYASWKPAQLVTRTGWQYGFWVDSQDVFAVIFNETKAGVGVAFLDDDTTRTDVGIPGSLSLGEFDRANVQMVWMRTSSDRAIYALARIDSLTAVSAVPEPATYAMLSAGLLVAFAAAKRRRRG